MNGCRHDDKGASQIFITQLSYSARLKSASDSKKSPRRLNPSAIPATEFDSGIFRGAHPDYIRSFVRGSAMATAQHTGLFHPGLVYAVIIVCSTNGMRPVVLVVR